MGRRAFHQSGRNTAEDEDERQAGCRKRSKENAHHDHSHFRFFPRRLASLKFKNDHTAIAVDLVGIEVRTSIDIALATAWSVILLDPNRSRVAERSHLIEIHRFRASA